jgi:hypothetical protein
LFTAAATQQVPQPVDDNWHALHITFAPAVCQLHGLLDCTPDKCQNAQLACAAPAGYSHYSVLTFRNHLLACMKLLQAPATSSITALLASAVDLNCMY